MQFDVKIRKVIENGKPLKALASVTVDGSFTIHNVRVIKTENAQFVAMPYATFKDADGKDVRRDIVHPIKSEVRKSLEVAVFAAYEQKLAEKAEYCLKSRALLFWMKRHRPWMLKRRKT